MTNSTISSKNNHIRTNNKGCDMFINKSHDSPPHGQKKQTFMTLLIVSYDVLCTFILKYVYHSNGSDTQIPTLALFLHLHRLNLSIKSLQNPEKEHHGNSPVCLQTGPPAEWSGYVHLVSLRTGHLCAFVPEVNRKQKKHKSKNQTEFKLYNWIYFSLINTLHNFT